jgi:hypothetical protein
VKLRTGYKKQKHKGIIPGINHKIINFYTAAFSLFFTKFSMNKQLHQKPILIAKLKFWHGSGL